MSAPAFAWAMETGARLGLKPSDRLVLLYLADMANGAKVCWPGQETIAKFTGLAINTVMVAIRRLADRQLIRAEHSPGKASLYHILRPDTPANGAVATPAKQMEAAPAIRGEHPPNCGAQPPHGLIPPPPNRGDDPSYTQEVDPKRRADAREGRSEKSGGEGSGSPPPPAPPPKAPVLGATVGGDQAYRPLRPPSDDPLDQPVDPQQLADLANRVARGFKNNPPPRAAILDRNAMIEVYDAAGRPKPRYLAPEYLAAIRRDAGYGVRVS